MKLYKRIALIICVLVATANIGELKAQYMHGSTGLITIPTADMQPDGTFMAGANFVPYAMTTKYNNDDTANYFLNMTFLPFLEVGYLCTITRASDGVLHQDRSISVRFRMLKEAKWYPSLVVGSADITTTRQGGNIFESTLGNNYYSAIYGVATKNLTLSRGELGLSLGYYYDYQDKGYNYGPFCGVSFTPDFYPACKFMADYKTDAVSFGGAVKLFNHISVQAFCYDFSSFAGGLRYEVEFY